MTHTHMYIILCNECTDGGLPLVGYTRFLIHTNTNIHKHTHTHRDDTHKPVYMILCYTCADGGLPLVPHTSHTHTLRTRSPPPQRYHVCYSMRAFDCVYIHVQAAAYL